VDLGGFDRYKFVYIAAVTVLDSCLSEPDLDAVLPDGLQVESCLYNAALAYRQGSPFRLKMLKPLREYVVNAHPAADSEKQAAIENYLSLGLELHGSSMPLEGEKIHRLSTEFPNAIEAVMAALNSGMLSAIKAACGLGRFRWFH
jgi:hypothetical protein